MTKSAGPSWPGQEQPAISALLLAALIYEVRPFLRSVRARHRQGWQIPAWEFPAGRGRGLIALSGVGPAAARRAAQKLLAAFRPQIFLSVGFGGGLTAGAAPGTIVVGNSFWHFSPETGALKEVAPPPAWLPAASLVDHLTAAGVPASVGSIVTTPVIIAKEKHSQALGQLHLPVLDQETGAVAAVAEARGLPLVGLRAVTDAAGEEIPDFMARALNSGHAPGLFVALSWLARDPRRLGRLVHFWRRSTLAARNLARALKVLLPLLLN